MTRWHIRPTTLDLRIARAVAQRTSHAIERPARALTLIGDERLLLAAVAGFWLTTRLGDGRKRQLANHLATGAMAASLVPHLLKGLISQERPDRFVIRGRRHGVPKSGKPYDAFPSGHAMSIGAVASALSRFYPQTKWLVWSGGCLVATTRVLLLAHWTTDVLVGLGSGVAIERLVWLLSHAAQNHSPDA